jgi:hypothetical protein
MTTALDMIKRAMRLNGDLAQGEPPSAQEAEDGLSSLNTMLDSWWNESLAVYRLEQESFSLTAGTGTYTIGSGGAFNTLRPISIVSAFVRYQGVDYPPLEIITGSAYDAIPIKTTRSIPEELFYDNDLPLGSINLFPVPHAVMTLFISSPQRLQSFATLTTDLVLPPGYQRALEFNLAVEYSADFGHVSPPQVIGIARESKAILKRANTMQPCVGIDEMWAGGTNFNYLIPAT